MMSKFADELLWNFVFCAQLYPIGKFGFNNRVFQTVNFKFTRRDTNFTTTVRQPRGMH